MDSEAGERDPVLDQIAAGDAGSLQLFYDSTSPQAYGLALRITQDPLRAERACEAAYRDVAELARTAKSRIGLEASLLGLVRQRAIDERPARAAALSSASPDASYVEVKAIREGLEQLDPTARKVLDLAYFGGMGLEDVSLLLERPVAELRTLLREALLQLGRAVSTTRESVR